MWRDLGDFIKLNLSRIKNAYGLKQIVQFSTRGQSKLDLGYTNLSAFYDVPSDHDTVEVQLLARQA
jgi:hypothetical protein